jgi:hypothetical protein
MSYRSEEGPHFNLAQVTYFAGSILNGLRRLESGQFPEPSQGASRCWRDNGGEIYMAIERNPNDPYRAEDPYRENDPTRPVDPTLPDEGIRRSSRLETDLQADPELAEGPAGGPKIALMALAIALLLGAVFYGLNNSPIHRNGTSSTAQKSAPATAQNTTPTPPPATSPGNPPGSAKPGVTTGAAPSQTPPPPAPNAPANNAPASK